jgi:Fe-Mn family superoxide dismutase
LHNYQRSKIKHFANNAYQTVIHIFEQQNIYPIMKNNRRDFIRTAAILSAGSIAGVHTAQGAIGSILNMAPMAKGFELPPLGYTYDALEPFIDTQTMQLHHDKHHQAYVTKLNEAVNATPALQGKLLEDLIKNINTIPESVRTAVRNNGGGHWNHSFFWTLLQKETSPSADMVKVINDSFGSMEQFTKDFEKAATSVFGSGWAWVIKDGKKLAITTTPNQDNPLMDVAAKQGRPIMGIDVWEHAYYLKYQNRRAEYLGAYWKVLNWKRVEELYNGK